MAVESTEYTQSTYDRVADGYDALWSRHVASPNERLTRELRLARGERVADLACGTGLYTVEMARRVAPGEVVAVDYSEGMLAAARERVEAEGLSLTLVHTKAEDFVATAPSGSFDVVSCRFALAYVDWREVLPRMGRLLRPGGRVGLLTSLSSSTPQFFDLFDRYRGSFGAAWSLYKHVGGSFAKAFRVYHRLRGIFGDAHFIAVPDDVESAAERLAAGGLRIGDTWTDRIRLWFESGDAAIVWARDSGYLTHPSLARVDREGLRFAQSLFSAGMETFREPRGVPLDLVIGGVIAERR
ncbi:MAG TPA: methyltransferase domain-containing protein [Vicinamibacteria bacterium]|jgi:ubiquinone/menaquinone biosynthesis C-methylase UbiE|nr:methyltransferase domain-containing protein [Vicinamibacteria bacterium]